MKAKILVYAVPVLILTTIHPVEAEQAKRVYRIGYLANSPSVGPLTGTRLFRGQNLIIEWRFSKGDRDRISSLAAELVNLKVDCIVAIGVGPAQAAKQASGTIPLVMGNADDVSVRQGFETQRR